MALYKSFDIEFSKEVLIMALLEEFIEFRVFSSYYIFSEVLYAQKKKLERTKGHPNPL